MNKFSKKNRIKSKIEFGNVLREGKKFVCPNFVILALDSTCFYPRLGLIVSKKVGNATVRNKVKRNFREIFRQSPYPESLKKRDYVIIARKKACRTQFKDLSQSIEKSFQWFEKESA